jgi:hypothetical protein
VLEIGVFGLPPDYITFLVDFIDDEVGKAMFEGAI